VHSTTAVQQQQWRRVGGSCCCLRLCCLPPTLPFSADMQVCKHMPSNIISCPADERSPLCGHTHDSLLALNAEVVVTFEGTTEVGGRVLLLPLPPLRDCESLPVPHPPGSLHLQTSSLMLVSPFRSHLPPWNRPRPSATLPAAPPLLSSRSLATPSWRAAPTCPLSCTGGTSLSRS
jgi:hypothetical protein